MGKSLVDKILFQHLVNRADEHRNVIYIDKTYLTNHGVLEEFDFQKVYKPNQFVAFTYEHQRSEWFHKMIKKYDTDEYEDEEISEPEELAAELGLSLPGTIVMSQDNKFFSHAVFGTLVFHADKKMMEQVSNSHSILMNNYDVLNIKLTQKTESTELLIASVQKLLRDRELSNTIVEITGDIIPKLEIEDRIEICLAASMFGARALVMQPDEIALNYLQGTEFAPSGAQWNESLSQWIDLSPDPEVEYSAVETPVIPRTGIVEIMAVEVVKASDYYSEKPQEDIAILKSFIEQIEKFERI